MAKAKPSPNESAKQTQNLSPQSKSQMVTDLKEVLKDKVRLNPEQEKKSNAILKEFLDSLTAEMKNKDPEFKLFFKKYYYTGSYFEGLRIKDADEFDINLVFKLPFKPAEREIEYQSGVSSFVKYKIKESPDPKILDVFFEGEYLMPRKVRIWMQSIVDKVLKSNCLKIRNVLEIKPSQSGPAKTIKLETSFHYTISIDLVPVIEFSFPEWPRGANRDVFPKFKFNPEEQCWFLVPKEYVSDGNLKEWDVRRLWRLHFPGIEKRMIHDLGCVKPVIKLLKLLRDKEVTWKILASYYLKTVLLWMVKENSDPIHWREDKMGERFMEVLKKLDSYVERKNIPYFFYPNFNLINRINPIQAENIHLRLQKIIHSIERDPSNLKTIF